MDPDQLSKALGSVDMGSMLDPWNIFFSILFGLIGFAYLAWGKKMGSFFFILSGLLLMCYTFFTNTNAEVIWYGLALCIIPFLLDRFL